MTLVWLNFFPPEWLIFCSSFAKNWNSNANAVAKNWNPTLIYHRNTFGANCLLQLNVSSCSWKLAVNQVEWNNTKRKIEFNYMINSERDWFTQAIATSIEWAQLKWLVFLFRIYSNIIPWCVCVYVFPKCLLYHS